MRTKVSARQIRENYNCIAVGYCQLQHLLTYASAPYYTDGVYGWNFDVYTFEYKGNNVAICTGYRGMVGTRVDYDIEREFEKRAETILTDDVQGNKKERLDALIMEFISVALPELK
jgi:hypothetical protein